MELSKLPLYISEEYGEEYELSSTCYLCGRNISEDEIIPNEKPICDICEAKYEYGM